MRALIAALALVAAPVSAESVDEVATRYALAGEILIAKGDHILVEKSYGMVDPAGTAPHRVGEQWRLASITKQITAVQILAADIPGGIDTPLPPELWGRISGVTLRQLLTHHSGLANPDDTPKDAFGVPQAYRGEMPAFQTCWSKLAKPGAAFAYNNCDYLVAGGFRSAKAKRGWPVGMAMARPGERGVPGFVGGKPEPRFELASWGQAGGLIGTARAVFDFDRALMTGKLLAPPALAELWKPEGKGSYQALGQWVFPGQLKGCAKPKRIVQRDGEIYGVQARNFIFPDDDLVVIVFTNRSSDDFAFGEVWEGKGFTYDLLSAAACPSA